MSLKKPGVWGVCLGAAWLWGPGAGWTQNFRPEDFLPLAVGNSWVYRHDYFDALNDPEGNGTASKELTLTITGREEVGGRTYYVFSQLPYGWPPLPYFSLSGTSVRFAADGRLVQREPEGEIALYDFAPGALESYAIPARRGDTLAVRERARSGPLTSVDFGFLGHGPRKLSSLIGRDLPEQRKAHFLQHYGMTGLFVGITTGEGTSAANQLSALYAIVEGRRITPEELRLERRTSVEPRSWGALKRVFFELVTGGKEPEPGPK